MKRAGRAIRTAFQQQFADRRRTPAKADDRSQGSSRNPDPPCRCRGRDTLLQAACSSVVVPPKLFTGRVVPGATLADGRQHRPFAVSRRTAPAGNLIQRTPTTATQSGPGIHLADVDARRRRRFVLMRNHTHSCFILAFEQGNSWQFVAVQAPIFPALKNKARGSAGFQAFSCACRLACNARAAFDAGSRPSCCVMNWPAVSSLSRSTPVSIPMPCSR